MILYVFSFFYISGHWRLNNDPWLFVRKIIRAVDKDKQLALISILEAMMMLKKAWGEVTSKQIETVSESQEFHWKLMRVLWMTIITHLEGWWMMVRTIVLLTS